MSTVRIRPWPLSSLSLGASAPRRSVVRRSDSLSVKEEASSLIAEPTDDLLRTPPDSETWSVAQVFDDMNTAGWLLLNSMEQAIQTGHEEGTYRHRSVPVWVRQPVVYSLDAPLVVLGVCDALGLRA